MLEILHVGLFKLLFFHDFFPFRFLSRRCISTLLNLVTATCSGSVSQ